MAGENSCSNSPIFPSTKLSKTPMKSLYKYISDKAICIFIAPGIFYALVHNLSLLNYFNEGCMGHLYIYAANHQNFIITWIFLSMIAMAALVLHVILRRPRKVYLLDFSCYKHDPSFACSREKVYEKLSEFVSPESFAFCKRVIENAQVSKETFIYGLNDLPHESSFAFAREEAEIVICGAVDDLMAKTGVDPSEIGVVIVNISTFNPVPSLSAMIVNRYKLRKDVLSYNLGGMGCSAGMIAVDLAKRLLQDQRDTYALLMSVECPTAGYYLGDDRSKLLPNCLFRMGGSAVLLSNRPSDNRASKYELTRTVRTHIGADDRAYNCAVQKPENGGRTSLSLRKDITAVAGDAMKANITALAPLVLPLSEKLRYLATLICRRGLKMKDIAPYVPDLTAAFEHFCIHAGGRGVLDAVEKNLNLSEWDMEPSRMTLYRYCNTSSSSLWYQLAYAEAKGRVKKGDRVWQIGFGSGFKCGSAVWRALKTINPEQVNNSWTEVIHDYPVLNRD